jgi:hypothetical protein
MFDLRKHQYSYFYDLATLVDNLIPENICDQLTERVNSVIASGQVDHVKHKSLGTNAVSDLGGEYNHHIFKGDEIREHLPELNAIYHALLPLISIITCTDAVVSPHSVSDINIKAYPAGGGTLGLHYDTNGITVLLFLTSNKEAPLRMQIERSHPSKKEAWTEKRNIYAKKGALLIMQGRKTLHDSEPTKTEQKLTVVYNYYERHDTYRHEDFDNFVYYGMQPSELA